MMYDVYFEIDLYKKLEGYNKNLQSIGTFLLISKR